MSRSRDRDSSRQPSLKVVVIWIDWYAYHLARFRGLLETPALNGRVAGIEMVGGEGVHAGMRFREDLPADLPITTLAPDTGWGSVHPLRLSWRLWRQLGMHDPSAVLVPGYYTLPAVVAAVWARVHDRESVLMTESTAADHRRSWWKESLKGLLIRGLFDSAVYGGKAHLRYLDQLGFPTERARGCYDVVDNAGIADRVDAVRRSSSAAACSLPGTPFFLYVGRLAPEKNVSTLLSAWLKYRKEGGNWPLVLVGDGPEKDRLLDRLKNEPHGPDVVFAGHQSASHLAPFYAFAGCFVLPSTREPWGLVVNEAMAAGLPVLVSSHCGSAEDLVLPGCNGFHFDPTQESQVRSLLHRMEQLTVGDRRQMRDASRSLVQAYSPQCFGSEIASLLRK